MMAKAYRYETEAPPITQPERAWAIETALASYQHRWLEAQLRSCRELFDAERLARRYLREWSAFPGDRWIKSEQLGLLVSIGRRSSLIPWREIALAARDGLSVQQEMF